MSSKDLIEPLNFQIPSNIYIYRENNCIGSAFNVNNLVLIKDNIYKIEDSPLMEYELTFNGNFSNEINSLINYEFSNDKNIDNTTFMYSLNKYLLDSSSSQITNLNNNIISLKLANKRKRSKHDKFEDYNIKRKLLSHYLNYISALVNTIIKFLLKENLEFSKIKHNILKEGLSKNTFKSLKEKTIEKLFLENDKNQKIYQYITNKNNIIINNILKEKCFKYRFVNNYYKNKKKFDFENYGLKTTIFLGSQIKTFEDLLKSNFSDKINENEKFKNKMDKCIKKFFFEAYFLHN